MTTSSKPTIDWYFDFVSPFSYLCFHRMGGLAADITYRPVLFAGLLNHWGQKGPAEIPAKRRYTYRWCHWWAEHLGIPFRFPAAHPFNPLPHLRLALAAGPTAQVVGRIFDSIWTTGRDAAEGFDALCHELQVSPEQLGTAQVKDALKKSTERAAQRGVFGVPSFVVENEVFWGADAIDFVKAFLADPKVLSNPEMRRIDALPVAAARK